MLADNSSNILRAKSEGGSGLSKSSDVSTEMGTLTIGVPASAIGNGKLIAIGGDLSAGIGSGYNEGTKNIMITGGIIEATGGNNAAGIGSEPCRGCF